MAQRAHDLREVFTQYQTPNVISSMICHLAAEQEPSLQCIQSLVARLRRSTYRHTIAVPEHTMREWDASFTYVFVHCLCRAHPVASWKRLLLQLMRHDLYDTPPYDGSDGPVKKLLARCIERLNNPVDAFASLVPSALDGEASDPFSVSPLLTSDDSLAGGWTLLHLAAASHCAHTSANTATPSANAPALTVENILALTRAGLQLGQTDSLGQTPLHVAARTMNLNVMHCLIAAGAPLRVRDKRNQSPLESFLATLSLCRWASTARATSLQIVTAIDGLCGNNFNIFWELAENPTLADIERNSLVVALGSTDDVAAQSLVSRCIGCARVLWKHIVVKHCIIRAIRRKRSWLTTYLWDSFDDFLSIDPSEAAPMHAFLQQALAAASVCDDASIISFLVRQASIAMVLRRSAEADPGPALWSPPACPFVHMAVLRGDFSALNFVLDSEVVTTASLLHPAEASRRSGTQDQGTVVANSSVIEASWLPFVSDLAVAKACSGLSPLSLVCLLGNAKALDRMLASIASRQRRPLSCQQCCQSLVSPIVCCALSANPQCLEILRSHMGPAEFATACNKEGRVNLELLK